MSHTTRETALERNRLVAALAAELVIPPHVSPGSALAEITALNAERLRRFP